jgi:hypothetical protein
MEIVAARTRQQKFVRADCATVDVAGKFPFKTILRHQQTLQSDTDCSGAF